MRMENVFTFTITHRDRTTLSRLGIIHTPHGDIETPAFVPVGTQLSVKSLTPHEIEGTGSRIFFVNTYHAYLRPGLDVIRKAGGLHTFMAWDKPLITDSGGFQIFSLGSKRFAHKNENGEGESLLVKKNENGVTFQSHWDGSTHTFTPEKSMDYQWAMGSDIHIAFDDCTPYPISRDKAEKSMEQTHRWAIRSLEQHIKLGKNMGKRSRYQSLYGVIQGSTYENLRIQSAEKITSMNFDGIAIGGVSVGESKKEMTDVMDWVMPILPENKPRHLLGVGEIDDIFMLIEHGVDTFDCVQPTRLARMGHVYTQSKENSTHNVFDITKSTFADDLTPIDKKCSCYTCQHFSRAYIHHLFKVRELLSYRLTTIHNMHFIHSLVREIRASVADGTFLDCKKRWLYND